MNNHACVSVFVKDFCHATPVSCGKSLFSLILCLFPSVPWSHPSLKKNKQTKKQNLGVREKRRRRKHTFMIYGTRKNNLMSRGGRGTHCKLVAFEFACALQSCVCVHVCVFVKAVYRCMSVQSLGSCSSAPTHHWMNIKLYLSRQQGHWSVWFSLCDGFIAKSAWVIR